MFTAWRRNYGITRRMRYRIDRLAENGGLLTQRLFYPAEYTGASLETLAGLFAAKEAAVKALGWPAGSWLQLYIDHDPAGAPLLRLLDAEQQFKDTSVSISHNGDTAIAVVAAIIE